MNSWMPEKAEGWGRALKSLSHDPTSCLLPRLRAWRKQWMGKRNLPQLQRDNLSSRHTVAASALCYSPAIFDGWFSPSSLQASLKNKSQGFNCKKSNVGMQVIECTIGESNTLLAEAWVEPNLELWRKRKRKKGGPLPSASSAIFPRMNGRPSNNNLTTAAPWGKTEKKRKIALWHTTTTKNSRFTPPSSIQGDQEKLRCKILNSRIW